MKKLLLLPAMIFGLVMAAAPPADAAGIPNADVTLERLSPDPAVVGPVQTDAMGSFLFENLPVGEYRLAATTDLLDADPRERSATLDFEIPVVTDPLELFRVAGLVTEDGLATVSFAVSAYVSSMDFIDAGITAAQVQPKWNRNWPRSRGRLHVRLSGTDLEAVTQVDLVSFPADPAAGTIGTGATITTTELRIDPIDGKLHAIFPKGTAFTVLAGPDAKRGDILPLQILVTTPAGVQPLEATVRIVGRRK